jgi:hypothetical protein
MKYYKKLSEETDSFCYKEQTPLKNNIESKLSKILNRITSLLKKKRNIVHQIDFSSESQISVEIPQTTNLNEESENESVETETISQYTDDSTLSQSNEDDYDQIENILNMVIKNKEKLFYVIFQDGGYGWLKRNQISKDLIKKWKKKH